MGVYMQANVHARIIEMDRRGNEENINPWNPSLSEVHAGQNGVFPWIVGMEHGVRWVPMAPHLSLPPQPTSPSSSESTTQSNDMSWSSWSPTAETPENSASRSSSPTSPSSSESLTFERDQTPQFEVGELVFEDSPNTITYDNFSNDLNQIAELNWGVVSNVDFNTHTRRYEYRVSFYKFHDGNYTMGSPNNVAYRWWDLDSVQNATDIISNNGEYGWLYNAIQNQTLHVLPQMHNVEDMARSMPYVHRRNVQLSLLMNEYRRLTGALAPIATFLTLGD